MSGFDCQFTEKPPQYLQTHCPICFLVLREPFQVTCCGKSFCRACIERLAEENQPCSICNQCIYSSFQNKGLQQPLYGFQVSCSNKESGCDWQGELKQLDEHLNLIPELSIEQNLNLNPFSRYVDPTSVGCAFVNIRCTFCSKWYPRGKIHHHQVSECGRRPFTCSMCKIYKSTYDDVITNHAPVCKCRPVECPNSCGANNLQHQHLEEHLSTQCLLSYVDCELSDAGCDAKVFRKDVSFHLEKDMVHHMSLLAKENRKLKLQLKEQNRQQEEKIREQEQKIREQEQKIEAQATENSENFEFINKKFIAQAIRIPPVDLVCTDVTKEWHSESFYTHDGGYKLKLHSSVSFNRRYSLEYRHIESEFPAVLPFSLKITVHAIHPRFRGEPHKMESTHTVRRTNENISIAILSRDVLQVYTTDNHLMFRVVEVKVL